MPIRASSSAVARIIEIDDTLSLGPYIEVASALVDECCAPLGYDEDRLTLIETWLAAHVYTIRDPRAASEGASGVNATYQGQTEMYFNSSIYGQHALLLDTRGGLAKLQATIKAGGAGARQVVWLGTRSCYSPPLVDPATDR